MINLNFINPIMEFCDITSIIIYTLDKVYTCSLTINVYLYSKKNIIHKTHNKKHN